MPRCAAVRRDVYIDESQRSGHYVHQTEPALVVEAIRQVVAGVRDPSSWATPAAATPAS